MAKKEIMLTGAELKEFKATGKTAHTYGGLTYIVKANDKGFPYVSDVVVLKADLPSVNFAGYINHVLNDIPVYNPHE